VTGSKIKFLRVCSNKREEKKKLNSEKKNNTLIRIKAKWIDPNDKAKKKKEKKVRGDKTGPKSGIVI